VAKVPDKGRSTPILIGPVPDEPVPPETAVLAVLAVLPGAPVVALDELLSLGARRRDDCEECERRQ
jgi:hypothetical protein